MVLQHLATSVWMSVFVLVIIFVNCAQGIAVMSIDLGSEWMKVAIVSPGVPMEIALNKESQRKTPVAVAFREDERLFGDSAITIGVRFPEKSYSYLLDLVGKTVNNPVVGLFKKRFPYYNIVADEGRDTVVFQHPEGTLFTPEELLAMILKQAQEIAQNAAGQPVKDAVITIPPYFNQAERRALLQAADMAGVTVLQLINSNTAVALQYGVFRRKDFNDTPYNILFYDMGAGSTVATVASYQLIKTKDKTYTESNPQLTIKGIGFDRTLGGLEMQLRLRDHLAKVFNGQKLTKSDVFKNNRAMAKLFKEAGRVKKVLSANTDHIAQVESLLEDKDFKTAITRAEFEEMCSDLFERVDKPVMMALESSGMTLEEIDQVILAGSGTRIPKVQQKLLEVVGKDELGKSVNTDEAAALGAAYQAAHLSKGFKVKTFFVKEANLYPIQVDFQREMGQEEGKSFKFVHRTLFARNNPYPQKKIMTFTRHVKDFEFFVNYGELNFLPEFDFEAVGVANLSKVSLKGVEAALSKHTGDDSEAKGVKAHFYMDDSGILKVEQIESVFEKKVEDSKESQPDLESPLAKLGSTIGRFFSGMSDKIDSKKTEEEIPESSEKDSKGKAEDSKENKTEESPKEQKTDAGEQKETPKSETPANDTKGEKKGPKVITVKEPISVEKVQIDLPDPNESKFLQSRSKLREFDDRDNAKLAKEKAKNSLESFILETKEKLFLHEYEVASTVKERDSIQNRLNEFGEWLEYESSDATADVFQEKLNSLKHAVRDLFDRVTEHKDRPEALKALHEMLNISEVFLNSARTVPESDQIFTKVELETLEKLIAKTHQWKVQSEEEQAKTPLTEMPKLTVKSVQEKIVALDREVKYLLNKARFATPKKKETVDTNVNKTEDSVNKTTTTQEEHEQVLEEKLEENVEAQVQPDDSTKLDDKVETEVPTSTEDSSQDKIKHSSHGEL